MPRFHILASNLLTFNKKTFNNNKIKSSKPSIWLFQLRHCIASCCLKSLLIFSWLFDSASPAEHSHLHPPVKSAGADSYRIEPCFDPLAAC